MIQGLITSLFLGIGFFELPLIIIITILFSTVIGIYLLLILHIFYPEAVLTSYEQLHRVKFIYSELDSHLKTGNFVKDIGVVTITNYLNSIPENVRREIFAD